MRKTFYSSPLFFVKALATFLVVFTVQQVSAQCGLSIYNQGGTVTPTACGWQSTSNIGSGTYITANVHNGGIYDFAHCNSANWTNSQMTGYVVGSGVLFYNDDNGPICNGQLASFTWPSYFTGTIAINSNVYNCQNWIGGGSGNSGVLDYRCTGPGNPSVFGNGEWIIYGWNAGDASGGAGAWTNCYSGFMTVAPLSFNTTTLWNASTSPSAAPNFLGCEIANDNHSWSAKRTGFTCGVYQIVIDNHDDLAQVFINGTQVANLPGIGGPNTVYTGVLTSASTVEFRVSEGTGTSQAQITITPVSIGSLSAGSITGNQTICDGGDPSIIASTALASGGAGPSYTNGSYTYDWTYQDNCQGSSFSIGSNTTSYDPPAPLNVTRCYTRVITDACGNTAATSPVTVTISPPITITYTSTNALCSGGSSGSITVNATGGTAPYEYSVDGGGTYQNNPVFTGLPAGNYNITVRDVIGCVTTYSGNPVVIGQPTPITQTLSKTDASCANVFDGTITVSASGGTPPYRYSLNGGPTQPGSTFTGVGAGNYTVSVFDNNNCEDTASISVANTYIIAVTLVSQTNVSCFGNGDGAATIQVTGGVPPYSYSINGTSYQSSPTFTGLSAGTYTATGRDARGCTEFVTFTITQPGLMNASIDSITHVLCNGDSTGAIYISVYGGNGGNTFVWSNGTTNEDNLNIPAGTYNVTVTDALGCTTTNGVSISQPAPLVLNIASYNDLSCFNDSSGAIDVTANGGTPGYSYSWDNGSMVEDQMNLFAGTYSVTVTDAYSCTQTISQVLSEPTALSTSIAGTDATCSGANNGSADLTVSGGTTPYTFAWSNFQNTEDASGLGGGPYFVTVTDLNGCSVRDSVMISEPSPIVTSINVTNITCFGASDGQADLSVSGGTPGYTFVWSNGETTEDLNSLAPGTYVVTVTDTLGCVKLDSFSLVDPAPFYVSGVIKHVTCFGYNDGAIDITAYGGVLPYSFNWSTGQSTEDLWNLPGGSDTVTVTDFNGCEARSIYVVNEPALLVVDVVGTDVLCHGTKTGSVAAVPSGGTTPYTYLWNTFDTDSMINGVIAGRYTVQLTDSNGCFTYDSLLIIEPADIVITGVVTDVACNGDSTGAIDITVTGGTTPYVFSWSNGETTEDLTNLPLGVYTVQVTDSNGCVKSASFTVNQSISLFTTVSLSNPLCFGASNGFIAVDVTGGTIPYNYTWNTTPAQTGATATNLLAGTYSLTVSDINGCSAVVTETLTDPAQLTITTTPTDSKCYNTATGLVAVFVAGGTPPYVYQLNGVIQATDTFRNLLPGNYIIAVRDANGCEGTKSFTIASPSEVLVDLVAPQDVILQGMATQLVATATSPQSPVINYYWSPLTDSSGAPVFSFDNCPDPDNCNNPYVSPLFTTVFTVAAMNADSCYGYDTVTVYVEVQPSAFIPTAFTPNSDGLNDRFEFDILGATDIEVSVFNRWGERVYYNANQANGITGTNGWDGTFDGKLVPFDTYVYQMKVTYFDSKVKDVSGTITLMR